MYIPCQTIEEHSTGVPCLNGIPPEGSSVEQGNVHWRGQQFDLHADDGPFLEPFVRESRVKI